MAPTEIPKSSGHFPKRILMSTRGGNYDQNGKRYSQEFKEEAMKLAERVGFTQASKGLGVHHDNIRNWAKPRLNSRTLKLAFPRRSLNLKTEDYVKKMAI